jgi:hypothetical protein
VWLLRNRGLIVVLVNCTEVMLIGRSDSLSKQKRPYNSTPGNAIAALMMEQHKKSQRTS